MSDTQTTEAAEPENLLGDGEMRLDDDSALDEGPIDAVEAAMADNENAREEPSSDDSNAEAPFIFNIDDDTDDAEIRRVMGLSESDPEQAKEIKKICRGQHENYSHQFSVKWQLSLSEREGLARGFSQRYKLEYFPRVVNGQLTIHVHALIERCDEVHPDTILNKFGDMLDAKTRGYLMGQELDEQREQFVPIVDQNGQPLRMKSYYMPHWLMGNRKHFRGRGMRSGPYSGEMRLEHHLLKKAKWAPGTRILGQTFPHRSYETHNCDRYFYVALMSEKQKASVQNMLANKEDVAMAYHQAFGMTPRMLADFDRKPGFAVYDTSKGKHKRRDENPLGFIAVMAKSSMPAIQWNIDEQEPIARKLFDEQLCRVTEPTRKKDRLRGRSA